MAEDEKHSEEEKKEDKDKRKTPQSITDANAAAERLERAVEKHKEQLDRQEDMIARQILGGRADAGETKVDPKTKEQLASEARVQAIGEAGGAQWAQPKKE